jgi:hypothetical protein
MHPRLVPQRLEQRDGALEIPALQLLDSLLDLRRLGLLRWVQLNGGLGETGESGEHGKDERQTSHRFFSLHGGTL